MQRIILAFLLFCVAQANAIYISTSIGDSRIQSENKIYKPGGIIHCAFEAGIFNESDDIVDFKFAIGIDRFGYSHSNGDKSVSLWEVYLKPVIFSITKNNVMFEIAPYLGRLLGASGLTDNDNQLLLHTSYDDGEPITMGYEYRLGYNINERFLLGLTANYHYVAYGFHHNEHPYVRDDNFLMGGWGLNFQYNLPW